MYKNYLKNKDKGLQESLGFDIVHYKKLKSGLRGNTFRVYGSSEKSRILKFIKINDKSKQEIEPKLYKHFLSKQNIIPTPNYIGYIENYDNQYGIMILEDLGDFNSVDSIDTRILLAKEFARWHFEMESRFDNYKEILKFENFSDKLKNLENWFNNIKRANIKDFNNLKLNDSSFIRFLDNIPYNIFQNITLEHGDPDFHNIKIDNNFKIQSVCDWECAQIGNGLEDLIRISDFSFEINNTIIEKYIQERKINNFEFLFEITKICRYLRIVSNLLDEYTSFSSLNQKEKAEEILKYLTISLQNSLTKF